MSTRTLGMIVFRVLAMAAVLYGATHVIQTPWFICLVLAGGGLWFLTGWLVRRIVEQDAGGDATERQTIHLLAIAICTVSLIAAVPQTVQLPYGLLILLHDAFSDDKLYIEPSYWQKLAYLLIDPASGLALSVLLVLFAPRLSRMLGKRLAH